MKRTMVQWAVVVTVLGSIAAPAFCAEESSAKVLPTLLIKGEVVSVDASDASATLLKVKDRYGFETPIYLAPETKISQGSQAMTAADLKTGAAVEVEYNFDINTAKRHAVSVALSVPAGTPVAAAPAAASSSTETTAPAAATTAGAAPAAQATTPAAPAAGSEPVPAMAMPESAPAQAPAASAAPAKPADTKTQ